MEENQLSKEADGFRLLRHHYKWRLKISHLLTTHYDSNYFKVQNNVNINQSFKGKKPPNNQ